MNVCNIHLEQQVAAPGTVQELPCKGRRCRTCGKCHDWICTGNSAYLDRIRNIILKDDVDGWNNERAWEHFRRLGDAKCTYGEEKYFGM